MQDWAEVQRLHRECWSNTAIAEKLGMSRNTVTRLLVLREPPRYERPRGPSLLDAFVEMRLDRLTEEDVHRAGAGADLQEDYRNRPEGHTVLLLGYVRPERPIHMVVGCEAFERDWSKPLVLVTVYVPEPPVWLDERTRARKRR